MASLIPAPKIRLAMTAPTMPTTILTRIPDPPPRTTRLASQPARPPMTNQMMMAVSITTLRYASVGTRTFGRDDARIGDFVPLPFRRERVASIFLLALVEALVMLDSGDA